MKFNEVLQERISAEFGAGKTVVYSGKKGFGEEEKVNMDFRKALKKYNLDVGTVNDIMTRIAKSNNKIKTEFNTSSMDVQLVAEPGGVFKVAVVGDDNIPVDAFQISPDKSNPGTYNIVDIPKGRKPIKKASGEELVPSKKII